MSKITVVAEFTAKKEKYEEAKAILTSIVPLTQAEEGCINYDLHESLDTPGKFLFYENWESREHWQKHGQTDHIQNLRAEAKELFEGEIKVTTWQMIP